MTWLSFIVWMFWGCVVLGCVRLITGAASTKGLAREVEQLRRSTQRADERLTELESSNTGLRNHLESLKVSPIASKWSR